MPFYSKIKIRKSDSDTYKSKKRRVAAKLQLLQNELKKHFKESNGSPDGKHSIKIATWNLREFGAGKYNGRSFESLYYIAEIISHFDIVALQEIRADLEAFSKLKRILGPSWSYIATDVTGGKVGNGERMVFLYKRTKVQFKDIVGELTLKEGSKIKAAFGERILLQNGMQVKLPNGAPSLSGTYKARTKRYKDNSSIRKLDADLEIPLPPGSILEIPDGSHIVVKKNTVINSPGRGKATVDIPQVISGESFRLRFPENSFDDSFKQFARTPFMISFQAGWLKVNLCTVHIFYGDKDNAKILEQRRSEIEQLTAALADKAKGEFKYDDKSFMGVLGDFNILGKGHPTMEALESNDFVIPEKIKSIPLGSNVERDKTYDQIAFWKPSRVSGYARLDVKAGNIFDFYKHVFTLDEEVKYRKEFPRNGLKPSSTFKTWRTYKMSDHLPMWIELRTDFSDEYLEAIRLTDLP